MGRKPRSNLDANGGPHFTVDHVGAHPVHKGLPSVVRDGFSDHPHKKAIAHRVRSYSQMQFQ